jgi:hypothetical protein
MNKSRVCVCVLLASMAAAGCQETQRSQSAVAEQAPASPKFTTMTLSVEQLMSLDWGGRTAGRSTIVDKRAAGTGVEFDIRFPGNDVGISSIDYVSTGAAGKGTLAGIDVTGYEALALKFTLISVNGRSDPNLPLELAVGTVIGPAGDGKISSCVPVVLGLSPEKTTKVAMTPMHTERTRVVGIHAHVANPKAWDINGGVVTLRVEPAAEAQVLATPVAAPERKSPRETTKAAPRRPRMEAVETPAPQPPVEPAQAAEPKLDPQPDSKPDPKTDPTPESKPRAKSSSEPTFGTRRIGAW